MTLQYTAERYLHTRAPRSGFISLLHTSLRGEISYSANEWFYDQFLEEIEGFHAALSRARARARDSSSARLMQMCFLREIINFQKPGDKSERLRRTGRNEQTTGITIQW
jgi:hypothetical protein